MISALSAAVDSPTLDMSRFELSKKKLTHPGVTGLSHLDSIDLYLRAVVVIIKTMTLITEHPLSTLSIDYAIIIAIIHNLTSRITWKRMACLLRLIFFLCCHINCWLHEL